MPTRRARYPLAALLTAACSGILCGCAMLPITASTACRDYLAHDEQTRRQAAVQIAGQQNSPFKGPMAGPAADAICTSSPERSLGRALGEG